MGRVSIRRAMTLIELVVVLGLLAGLATVALQALDGLGDRDRADTTRLRLDAIRDAVVGDGRRAGRFLQDMGRYPLVRDTGEGELLSELWTDPKLSKGSGSGFKWDEVEDDLPSGFVTGWLPAIPEPWFGWRGPYLIPGAGDKLYDGYGGEFRVADSASPDEEVDWRQSGESGLDGKLIYGVRSFGRDNKYGDGADWTDQDEEILFSKFTAQTSVSLEITVLARDSLVAPAIWRQPKKLDVWKGGLNTSNQMQIVDSSCKWVFKCVGGGGGQTSNNEPLWIVTKEGDQTPDNGLTWEYLGPLERFPCYQTNLVAVLFVPGVTDDQYQVGGVWTNLSVPNGSFPDLRISEADLPNKLFPSGLSNYIKTLTPGLRKLYVFAYFEDGTSIRHVWASGVSCQTVELHPGANHVTVYLTERLQ